MNYRDNRNRPRSQVQQIQEQVAALKEIAATVTSLVNTGLAVLTGNSADRAIVRYARGIRGCDRGGRCPYPPDHRLWYPV
jgi:hypothetical protein